MSEDEDLLARARRQIEKHESSNRSKLAVALREIEKLRGRRPIDREEYRRWKRQSDLLDIIAGIAEDLYG